ncbi:MAG: cell division protein FtsQ/DivIB [Rhodospirillales bacterium]
MSAGTKKDKAKAKGRSKSDAPKRPVMGRRAVLRLVAGAGAALSLALVIGGGVWTVKSGLVTDWTRKSHQALVNMTRDLGLKVGDVMVTGRNRTSQNDLLAALGTTKGAPILTFDPAAAADAVRALPWVREASVERLLPDTILVRIVEREPLALWQNEGAFRVIDSEGEALEGVDPGLFSKLPRVVGAEAARTAPQLFAMLAEEPALAGRVQAAIRVGGRRWNLVLDGGIDVRLPEEDAAGAWSRLADYDRTHSVLTRDVQVLDLRLPDRLIVRMPGDVPDPVETAGPTGREA